MNRSQLIYVENISPTSSEQNLQVYLEKFAPVQAVYFLREKQCTKRSIAAFLRVANETDRDIIMLRNQQNYRGKRLFMLQADKPHEYQADLTIIVRNITNKISEENLFEHFEDCGKIAFLQIRTDDFAYIGFEDKSAVRNALNKNNQPLKGSSLKIQVLTRNLDIMIVNLDTLASRMPNLYRKMILPVEPRAPDNQSQSAVAEQPQQPKQQEQPRQQQQQPKQQQQQTQQQMSRQQQQYQQGRQQQQQRENEQRQQRENQQRQQRENQQLQQQMQAQQQQRLQQQQQILQQNKPLPQRQQNQRPQQQQVQSQGLQQQQQQLQAQIQLLKDKANVLSGKQQQRQQQQQPMVEPLKPAPQVQQPKQRDNVEALAASDTDEVQIVEVMETQEIIEDDDDDEVQIVEKPPVEPVPSEYVPKPDDLMRPIKASEVVLQDVPKQKSEDDVRAVWVNNIQPETRRIDLVLYLEQFGDVIHCKIGNSNNCAFTRWAKVIFTTEDAAARAAEYFLHPFQGRYLFVLRCSKYVVEEPGKVFTIDFLSKYVVYEDVVKAFKGIGEMFYLVRLYDNSFKVRIFFLDKVDEQAVLAVNRIDGRPAKLEPYVENMTLRLPKTLAKELKDEREILDPEKEARLAKIDAIYKQEALDRCAIREYKNPNPKSSPVEVVIYNVPVNTTDQQIKRFFKPVGEPTAIRREPIETETHVVREVERVFVGFRTLSMAMQAAEIPPEKTLNSYNPFIFTAWTQAVMSDKNTVRLFFNKFISIQDIYNGLSHCGPIKYIEKQRAKRALVVFGNGETGLLNTKKLSYIGDTKITNQDFTEIYTTAGAIDGFVDAAPSSAPTTAPPLPFASHEINIGSKSSGSSKTPNPIPTVATPNNELPTSGPTGKKTKGPTASDHCNYVFGTWRVSKLLSKDDCLKIDIFLRQYDVSVAYLQEVKFKQAKIATKFYHWHIIKPHPDAQTWSEQIKSGGAILLRQSLMQTATFTKLRDLSTVQLSLFSRPLTVAYAHIRTAGMGQQPDPEIVRMQNDIEKMNAKKRVNCILLGHFNARIGSKDSAALQGLVGEHLGYTVSDRNGQVLKEILQSNQLKLISSFGPCPSVQWTCTQAGKREQIDHIMMSDMDWVKQPECRSVADHCFVSVNRLLLLSLKWPFTKRFAKMNTKELLKSTTENLAEKLDHGSEPKEPTPCMDTLMKNMCEPFIFATWNVSGCARESDREIVDEMLHSHGITVACIQETQMKPGSVLTKNYKWFNVNCSNAGIESAQIEGGNAILINSTLSQEAWCERKSDNICCATVCMPWGQITIISVYARSKKSRTQPDMELETLKKIVSHLAQEKKHYIILGGFNARFGILDICNRVQDLFGDHLIHNRSNANGKLIKKMMRSHKLKLISSFGPSPSVRFTCEKDNMEAQLDHILIPSSNELRDIECQCIDGQPGFSNHRLLTIKASYNPIAARTSTGPEIAALAYGPEPFDPNAVGNTKKKAAQKSSPSSAPSSSQNESEEADTIKIATWNVSGCKLELERDDIDEHLNAFKITLACLQDTRLQNNTTFETENYTWFNYNQDTPSDVGGNAIIVRNELLTDCTFQRWSSHICSVKLHFFGSDFTIFSVHASTEGNDKQPDPELNTLYDIISRMSPDERDNFIVLGSLNAKVGSQELLPGLEPYIGKCLAHTQSNPNGEFIQKILMEFKLHLSSSYCYKNLMTTWKRGDEEAQIDHVFMPFVAKFWPPRCHCIRSLTGYSDHRIIMLRLKHRRRPLVQDNTGKSACESSEPNPMNATSQSQVVLDSRGSKKQVFNDDTIIFGTWNVSGCALESVRAKIDRYLHTHYISIGCIQDTRLQNNTTFKTEHYTWFNVNQEPLPDAGGTAIVVRKNFQTECDFKRLSSHICSVKLKIFGGDFTVLSVHACTEGTGQEPDPELNTLHDIINRMSPAERNNFLVLGGLNAEIGSKDLLPGLGRYVGQFLAYNQSNANGKLVQKILIDFKLKLITSYGLQSTMVTWKKGNDVAQTDHILMPDIERFWKTRCRGIDGVFGLSDYRMLTARFKHCLPENLVEKSASEPSEPFSSSEYSQADEFVQNLLSVVTPTSIARPLREPTVWSTPSSASMHIFGTWNVSGCPNDSDRDIVDQFLVQHGVSVACLQETHMPTSTGKTDNYTWFNVNRTAASTGWSGGTAVLVRNDLAQDCKYQQISDSMCAARLSIFDKLLAVYSVNAHTTAINADQPDTVFNDLSKTINTMPRKQRENFIVMGGFNAQIGLQDKPLRLKESIGNRLYHPFSNANGEGLKLILQEFDLRLCSSFGPSESVKCTWKSGNQQAQIDHIVSPIIDRFTKPNCSCVEELAGFSDHRMLLMQVRHKLSQKQVAEKRPREAGNFSFSGSNSKKHRSEQLRNAFLR